MEQQIAFCTAPDGVRIAYGTYGNDDAPPLIHFSLFPPQEAVWAAPWGRAWLEALGRSHRLITVDPRGYGASQRDVESSTIDNHVIDLLAVADHLRIPRFALVSGSSSAAVTITFAARYSGRVTHLVQWGPHAVSQRRREQSESAHSNWSMYTRAWASIMFPSGPPEAQRWFSASLRSGTSPAVMAQFFEWTYDLTELLPQLTMPVLILHRRDAQNANLVQARAAASLMPNARLVALDGDVGAPHWNHQQFIHVLWEFLGVRAEEPEAPLEVVTDTSIILFLDIADSTALTERMGDAAFRERSKALEGSIREAIRATGGRPVEGRVLGDGVLALFDAAVNAIDAARRCHEVADDAIGGRSPEANLRPVPLKLHIGIHAGDVIREPGNVYGGAVNIAARICGLSAPGETLVSDVVRALALTSAGARFEDRGVHALKGIHEPQRVYVVRRDGA